MSKQTVVITRMENRILSTVLENNHMIQIYSENEQSQTILGNIYLARVQNIIKNIGAAFVEIENGIQCYLPTEKGSPIYANPKKDNIMHIGDELIVQVTQENVKTKQPSVTSNLNLTGKYIVLTRGKTSISISSKIRDTEERNRLQGMLSSFHNKDYGFIVRTSAHGASEEQVVSEAERLIATYQEIKLHGIHKSRFTKLFQAPASYLTDIRDGNTNLVEQIITDDRLLYQEIEEYLTIYQKEDIPKLRFYEDAQLSLGNLYNIATQLQKAMQKKVWLNCGGSIVIEPTEACTVIDVNTGKAIQGKKKVQDTFMKVNKQAAEEIASQLRLRNLSGIIIIDFIDLTSKEAKLELIEYLTKLLHKDPVKTVVVDMTSLGLIEVTRKKVRKPLHEQMRDFKGLL